MEPGSLPLLVIGLWIGGIVNAIWYYWWGWLGARKGKPIGKYKHPLLSIFEHYHWATILYILGFRLDLPILVGVATVLLLDESLAQSHKFALGSGHFKESLLLELLILSSWMFAEALASLL